MYLKNKLDSVLSDERLIELVHVAAGPLDLSDVLVEIGRTNGLDGEAAGLFRTPLYGWDAGRYPAANFLVRAAFPHGDLSPAGGHWPCTASRTPAGPGTNHLHYIDAYEGLPAVTVHDLEEELVYILGHEFRHLAQWRADQAANWTLYLLPDGSHDADAVEHEAEAAGQAILRTFRAQR